MALLTCDNVSFSYESSMVVENLNFKVIHGDYLCVVGQNGSGKSTLIKGLLGLKLPSKGKVVMGDGLKSREIGYLPQHTMAQKDFPASVKEVVLSGRLNRSGRNPFYTKQDKLVAMENLARLGIEKLKNKCYRELSGGQQQRVLLARALCATKKMLLLDEPVSGLDPVVASELYQLIMSINKDMGVTVVMVSHDIKIAVRYASHVLHLNNKQAFFGTADGYIKSNIGQRFLSGENDD